MRASGAVCYCGCFSAGTQTISDVCLPVGRSERVLRSNFSAIFYGVGNLDLCRKQVLPLLNEPLCRNGSTASPTHCSFRHPSVSFINSKFYAFSEFYYTMEDILRMGGKYNSVRFQLAAQVGLFTLCV